MGVTLSCRGTFFRPPYIYTWYSLLPTATRVYLVSGLSQCVVCSAVQRSGVKVKHVQVTIVPFSVFFLCSYYFNSVGFDVCSLLADSITQYTYATHTNSLFNDEKPQVNTSCLFGSRATLHSSFFCKPHASQTHALAIKTHAHGM